MKTELAKRRYEEEIAQRSFRSAIYKSQSIVEKKLVQKLKQIFGLLDGDKDGSITSEQINSEHLPPEILAIFKPLLAEMESFDESLNQSEFVESSTIMLQNCTINERNMILNFGNRKKERTPEYSFAPKVNNRSAILASRLF